MAEDAQRMAHKSLLAKRYGVPLEVAKRLSQHETDLIVKYYYWLQGLERGEILPFTEAQKRFLSVCKKELTPHSELEILWLKVKRLLPASRPTANTTRAAPNPIVGDPIGTRHYHEPIEAHSGDIPGSAGQRICPYCQGDGGAKGECYKCSGTGWVK